MSSQASSLFNLQSFGVGKYNKVLSGLQSSFTKHIENNLQTKYAQLHERNDVIRERENLGKKWAFKNINSNVDKF